MPANDSTLDPTTTKFEATEPAPVGKMPGEDPFKLDVHLKDKLLKAAGSSLSGFLKVEAGDWKDYYMTIDSNGWAALTKSAETTFVLVPYYAEHYVVVTSGSYLNSYLSFNAQSYIGAYKMWDNARYWSVNPLDSSPWPGLWPYRRTVVSTPWVCVNGVKDGHYAELIRMFAT